VPGGTTTDPYRTIDRWTAAGRGRVDPVSFPADDGATLNGYLFRPPAKVKGPYPGVVITTGSIQGYQQMYFWAAEGLAEAGYEVLTYDVQGQGTSDTLPGQAHCTGPNSCSGVPFQQSYNFYQGTEDALNFFFSSKNPGRAQLDASRVGIAGHSLGASAVSEVGQCDPRVKAIVAWDNLRGPGPAPYACPSGSSKRPDATAAKPSLGMSADYGLTPTPYTSDPDRSSKSSAAQQIAAAGVPAGELVIRGGTHYEFSFIPNPGFGGTLRGEDLVAWYTTAWFDRFVKGDKKATARLFTDRWRADADEGAVDPDHDGNLLVLLRLAAVGRRPDLRRPADRSGLLAGARRARPVLGPCRLARAVTAMVEERGP
jgi:dienelactone hydrolase